MASNELAKSKSEGVFYTNLKHPGYLKGNVIGNAAQAFGISRKQYFDNLEGDDSAVDMAACKDRWLNIIRIYRDDALAMLDGEEAEAKSENDSEALEEIEIIKQMLRDLPGDVDLSSYSTLEDLITYWPPLLLPAPIIEETFLEKIK